MKSLARYSLIAAAAVAVTLAAMRILIGGGMRLEDRSTPPLIPFDQVETVADLDYPPGNIAVSASGRIFFTLHPDGKPPVKVLELVDGKPTPYPDMAYQSPSPDIPYFQSILSIRLDSRERLWVLDYADFGRGHPRIDAFDINTGALVHSYEFPPEVAGLGSMLNDMQIDPQGRYIYIAETSPLLQTPALIVYDSQNQVSRRLLQGHDSVRAEKYLIHAPGREMRAYGLVALRLGIDSIALDKRGEWLYYGPVTGQRLYRVRTTDLDDATLGADELAARVEDFAAKTLSDGITMDLDDNLYLSDMEHSAVHRIDPQGRLQTLIRDPALRWPDGFSFGPDGWLYLTCSSLQTVLFVGQEVLRENAPYQIFRFRPGSSGVPGH